MKKLLVLLLLVSGLAHAEGDFAIGPLFHLNNTTGSNNIDVTIKYDDLKFDIGDNSIAIDKLFVEDTISGSLGFFLGLGLYSNFDATSFGARIPVGLSYDFSADIDMFYQYVYSFVLEPTTGNNGGNSSIGLRFYF